MQRKSLRVPVPRAGELEYLRQLYGPRVDPLPAISSHYLNSTRRMD